jgi:antitoxin VapB
MPTIKEDSMQPERNIRLFRNGRNQAVGIPRDFELDGNEAIIRKDGNRLILEPVSAKNRLVELLKTLNPFRSNFQKWKFRPKRVRTFSDGDPRISLGYEYSLLI